MWSMIHFQKARWRCFAAICLAFAISMSSGAADDSSKISAALQKAGENRKELEKALQNAPEAEQPGIKFLLENMTERDLKSLSAEFLLQNSSLAYSAWKQSPWHDAVSEELFLNEILPYANINETREAWRKELRELSLPMVEGAKTITEATIKLNQQLFPKVKVKYSTQRKKANQSPSESMSTGLASCTGLSILLVDACRSVGIPARLAGIPNWIDNRGNHTWVEVWDGDWHFTGAAEQDPNGLDRGWFAHDASLAVKDSKEHAIYATSFKRTDLPFPMVWSRNNDYVSAVNVTDRYTPKAKAADSELTRLMVKVMEYPGGKRVTATVKVQEEDSSIKMEGESKDEKFDTNDLLAFPVKKEKPVRIVASIGGRQVEKKHTTGKGAQELFVVYLQDQAPASVAANACTFPRCGIKALPAEQQKKVRKELSAYFEAPKEEQAKWKFDPYLDELISQNESAIRLAAWEAYKKAGENSALKKDYEDKVARNNSYQSPFTVKTVGKRPENGWPLFIAMHGGGGAPQEVNDSQWRVMQRYYKDHEELGGYLYVALRAPNNEWNGFYADYVYPLVDNLIKEFNLYGDIDPNKVFLMGYSHGGYGAFAIGPKMPDHFAAIHASAAAPTGGDTSAKTLRNTVFTFMVGEKDLAYGRLDRCKEFDALIKKLRGDRTDIYSVTLDVKLGYPHSGLPDRDMIKDMYAATRNTTPPELTWELTDSVIHNFFWLRVAEPSRGQELDATCKENKIVVQQKNVKSADILLDSRLIDFSKPVVIETDGKINEKKLAPSVQTLCETLQERGDPDLAFTARVPLSF
jgi:predicted esterase